MAYLFNSKTICSIIIHCSIFLHSHWLRAYDEFFVFCWWREHMTNNYHICHVLTPSETNTRFTLSCAHAIRVICQRLQRTDFVYNVQISYIFCLETYVMDIFSQLLPRRFQKTLILSIIVMFISVKRDKFVAYL